MKLKLSWLLVSIRPGAKKHAGETYSSNVHTWHSEDNMKLITTSLGGAVFVAVSAVVAGGVFDQFAVIEIGGRTDEKQWRAFLNFQQFGAVFVGSHGADNMVDAADRELVAGGECFVQGLTGEILLFDAGTTLAQDRAGLMQMGSESPRRKRSRVRQGLL